MQLTNFSGGLLTRVAPSLISAEFAVEHVNANLSRGPLQPVGLPGTLGEVIAQYAAWYNSAWKQWSIPTSWVEYHQNLYFTNTDGAKKLLKTGEEYPLGITKPSVTLSVTVSGSGPLIGTFTYVYTYYNTKDGTESNPCAPSNEVTANNNAIAIPLVASTESQVDKIRVYRVGGNQLNYTLVSEVANSTTTFTDNMADASLEGTLLLTLEYSKPPVGLQYLVEFAGTFFGAVANKLYFTEPLGNPNYWPETNYIRLPLDITGIAVTANGIVAFTKYTSYIITGTDYTTFVLLLLAADQGCTSHYSITRYKSGVLFTSTDGICYTDGSSVELLSYANLGKLNLVPTHAVVHDKTYYVLTTTGLIRWESFTDAYGYLDLGIDAIYVAEDTLYCRKDGKIAPMFEGTEATFSYKSAMLTEGAYSNLKTYNTVYIRADGEFTIEIVIDPQGIVYTGTFTGNTTHEISIPQSDMQGYAIQFALTGTATVYEIEYKVVGRENGV
jgi:hypothetical protein